MVVLKGRKVVGGVAEGEALVTRQTISGWGGVNPMLGTVTETRHELRGVSFKGKYSWCFRAPRAPRPGPPCFISPAWPARRR